MCVCVKSRGNAWGRRTHCVSLLHRKEDTVTHVYRSYLTWGNHYGTPQYYLQIGYMQILNRETMMFTNDRSFHFVLNNFTSCKDTRSRKNQDILYSQVQFIAFKFIIFIFYKTNDLFFLNKTIFLYIFETSQWNTHRASIFNIEQSMTKAVRTRRRNSSIFFYMSGFGRSHESKFFTWSAIEAIEADFQVLWDRRRREKTSTS